MKKLFSLISVILSFALLIFLVFPQKSIAQTTYLYVSNQFDNTVSVLDPTDGSRVATIPLAGNTPQALVFNGNYVYVASTSYNSGSGINVIDPRTNSLVSTIEIPTPGVSPITLDHSGSRLYASDQGGHVYVIDTNSNTVIHTISGFNMALGVAFNPTDTRMYVVNYASNSVSVLDTSNYSQIDTIQVGANPGGIVITPDGSKAYVGNYSGNSVSVVDLTTNQVINTIPQDQNVTDLELNLSGSKLYVMNQHWDNGTGNISVIDTSGDSIINTISVGHNPIDISFTPDGGIYFVTNSADDNILAFDAATDSLVNTFTAGDYPFVAKLVDVPTSPPPPTPTPTEVPTVTPTPTEAPTPTPTPIQLSALSPAKIWVGLKNSDDVGVKFDLKAEVYADNALVSIGELDSIMAGSSGFNNAKLNTIPFDSFSPVDFPLGTVLSMKVYVRNACIGSGHNSGTARLWYNDSAANSQFGTTIAENSSTYYLLNNFTLGTSTGSSRKSIDVASGAKCSAFKPFGTWTITLVN